MNQSISFFAGSSYAPLTSTFELKFAVSIMAVAFRGLLGNTQFIESATATYFKKVI